jgi:hypothetical protein
LLCSSYILHIIFLNTCFVLKCNSIFI